MFEKEGKFAKGQTKRTMIVYFSIIGAAALFVVYMSRYVLFHPWTEREWIPAAAVSGKIYTAGGKDSRRLLKDDILMIDPVKLTISDVESLPSPRFGVGAAGIEDKVIFIGGFNNSECLDEVVFLNARTKKVETIGHLPSPRAFGAAVESSGRIFYLGGWDGKQTLDEIVTVDPLTGDSKIIGRLPEPREYAAAVVIYEIIYVIGGSDQNGNYLADILAIDPISGNILKKEHTTYKKIRSSAAAYGGSIYVFGGWEGKKTDEVWMIDPDSEEFGPRVFATLPRVSSDTGAASLDNYLYLIGGVNERFHRQLNVIRFDPESKKSESLKFRSFFLW